MAISREQKEAQVAALSAQMQSAELTIFCAYSGLSVAEMQGLRARLRPVESTFRVAKNALLKRALSDVFGPEAGGGLEGPVAVAFARGDQAAAAKAIVDYAKVYEALRPFGAIDSSGGQFSADQVHRLAALPSREQLLGQLVGTVAAPLSGLLQVFGGNLRGLLSVLQATADKKEQAAA